MGSTPVLGNFLAADILRYRACTPYTGIHNSDRYAGFIQTGLDKQSFLTFGIHGGDQKRFGGLCQNQHLELLF